MFTSLFLHQDEFSPPPFFLTLSLQKKKTRKLPYFQLAAFPEATVQDSSLLMAPLSLSHVHCLFLGSARYSNQGQIFAQMKWPCGSHFRKLAEDKVKLA